MKDIIRKSLEKTCSPLDLGRWFEPLELAFDAEKAQISVLFPHAFFGPWFERQGQILFEHCAREVVTALHGLSARFSYSHPPLPTPAPVFLPSSFIQTAALPVPQKAKAQTDPAEPTKQEVEAREAFSENFESFIANAKNAFPLTAARQVAEAARPPLYNPFIICGKSGTGKTHILRALTESFNTALQRQGHEHNIFSASADIFTEALMAQGARDFVRHHSAIMVDDIQRVAHNRPLQEKIIRLLDYAQDSHTQIVFASTAAPASLEGLTEGLRSRLEVGLVVELKEADIDVRMRFAQAKARQHGLKLEREHLLLLAQRCSQIRHLSGILLKVTAFLSMVQRPITAEDLDNILRSSGEEKQMEAEDILHIVGTQLSVSVEDMLGSSRQPVCVRARQWAMYLCRELLGLSYPALGRYFGGKDHSTVMHSIKKITEIIKSDKDAQLLNDELKRRCLMH